MNSEEEVLDTICCAIEAAGYKQRVMIAMDIAASEFYDEKT